jgi:hypothetical protein
LKVCGVLTVVQSPSLKPGASAPGTSSRMNFQFRLKLVLARGDAGGTYGAAGSAHPMSATVATTRLTKPIRTRSYHAAFGELFGTLPAIGAPGGPGNSIDSDYFR